MCKKIVFILSVCFLFVFNYSWSSASELDIPQENIFVSKQLASKGSLRFYDQRFDMELDGKKYTIESYNVKGME